MKLDPAIKGKWVFALRSKVFTQGINYLEFKEATRILHCVQGVLLKLYELWLREQGKPDMYKFDSVPRRRLSEAGTVTYFNGACGALPNEVMAWAGLPVSDNKRPEPLTKAEIDELNARDRILSHLAYQNDQGRSFEELANYIETHL